MNTELLDKIKDEVAKEYGFKSFVMLILHHSNHIPTVIKLYDEVCRRYAIEVAKTTSKGNMKTETIISVSDFKLIKTFYPSFTRLRTSAANDYVIDWNGIMPVVDVVGKTIILREGKYGNTIDFQITNNDNIGWIYWLKNVPGDQNQPQSYPIEKDMIDRVTKSIIDFIKWFNTLS